MTVKSAPSAKVQKELIELKWNSVQLDNLLWIFMSLPETALKKSI